MKAALVIVTTLLALSSGRAEDARTRLRNASSNELCWDTARGVARAKHPNAKLDDVALTEASLKRSANATLVKETRKAFPGIRTC